MLFAFCVSWYFHDTFWWGPDDGLFAYIAQRILEGDVVHRDIQALHPGLLFLINSALLGITDGDVVSLRYPLVMLTLIQTWLAYQLTLSKGLVSAICASLCMIAFSFVQFINPTPNWYLITITLALGAFLTISDMQSNRALVLAGAIVGIAFLLRQLTGVFLAMAITTILFLVYSNPASSDRQHAGSSILVILAVCYSVFIFQTAQIAGLLLFGIFPLALLGIAAFKCNLGWSSVSRIITRLVAGALLTALPLIIYHLSTGSLGGFIEETFIRPFTFFDVPMVEQASYLALIYYPIEDILAGNLSSIFTLIFWFTLLIINLVLSIVVLRNLTLAPSKPVVLGILVIFHSLVALIYEIPIYLFYSTGLIFVALLTFNLNSIIRRLLVAVTTATSIFALAFHASQPLDRTYKNIALSKRVAWNTHILPTTTIKTNRQTSEFYEQILMSVESCALPSDTLYAFPYNPELYFLTRRRSAFKFINSIFGITQSTDLSNYIEAVKASDQPGLILHNTTDIHNTPNSDSLFAALAHLYVKRGQVDNLTVYQRKGHKMSDRCQISFLEFGEK